MSLGVLLPCPLSFIHLENLLRKFSTKKVASFDFCVTVEKKICNGEAKIILFKKGTNETWYTSIKERANKIL
jgi:hypothetical protein